MAGGLLQLLTIGAQDVYLSGGDGELIANDTSNYTRYSTDIHELPYNESDTIELGEMTNYNTINDVQVNVGKVTCMTKYEMNVNNTYLQYLLKESENQVKVLCTKLPRELLCEIYTWLIPKIRTYNEYKPNIRTLLMGDIFTYDLYKFIKLRQEYKPNHTKYEAKTIIDKPIDQSTFDKKYAYMLFGINREKMEHFFYVCQLYRTRRETPWDGWRRDIPSHLIDTLKEWSGVI